MRRLRITIGRTLLHLGEFVLPRPERPRIHPYRIPTRPR